jgi:hypothetical protein
MGHESSQDLQQEALRHVTAFRQLLAANWRLLSLARQCGHGFERISYGAREFHRRTLVVTKFASPLPTRHNAGLFV